MTVAFLGTKGGTGTTTITVNVAAELRRLTGLATAVLDLKPAPGDVALFLGLRPRLTLVHLLDRLSRDGAEPVSDYLSTHACGLDVLPAGDDWGRPSARDADGVEATVEALGASHPFVMIDAGSSLSPTLAVALQAADLVVLVANPDVPCLRNLQRLIDAVRLEGVSADRLRLLLNRASDDGAVSMARIGDVLGVAVDWRVPSDYRTVSAAVTSGVPVRALRSAPDLQRHLEGVARSLAEEGGAAGWSTRAAMVAPSDDPGASQ